MNRYMLIDEVTALVRVSKWTLWRRWKEGAFPKPVRMGKHRIAFVREEIEDWLKARESERDAA